MFLSLAFAMAPQGGEGGAQGFTAFVPLILIFVIFYFLPETPAKEGKRTEGISQPAEGRRYDYHGRWTAW